MSDRKPARKLGWKQSRRVVPYVFFRESGFYAVDLVDDFDAVANAQVNPGTIRVEDAAGRIVWSATTQN